MERPKELEIFFFPVNYCCYLSNGRRRIDEWQIFSYFARFDKLEENGKFVLTSSFSFRLFSRDESFEKMERSFVGTWDFPVNYYSLWNGRRTMTEEITSLSTPSLLNVLRFDKIRENGKLRLPPAGARFRIIWRGKDWRSKIWKLTSTLFVCFETTFSLGRRSSSRF